MGGYRLPVPVNQPEPHNKYALFRQLIILFTYGTLSAVLKLKHITNQNLIDDNTKPLARAGRKAYRVFKDSRVAEISKRYSVPAFFMRTGG